MRTQRKDPLPSSEGFRKAREFLELRQIEVAGKIGCSCASISRCESGKISCDSHIRYRLRDFYLQFVNFRDDGGIEKLGRVNAYAFSEQTGILRYKISQTPITRAEPNHGASRFSQILASLRSPL